MTQPSLKSDSSLYFPSENNSTQPTASDDTARAALVQALKISGHECGTDRAPCEFKFGLVFAL